MRRSRGLILAYRLKSWLSSFCFPFRFYYVSSCSFKTHKLTCADWAFMWLHFLQPKPNNIMFILFDLHKTPSFSIYLLSCNSRKFRAFVQFGGPTSRRNSLRKKLTDGQKVNQNFIPLNPRSEFQFLNSNFVDYESQSSNSISDDSVKESKFGNGVADDSVAEMGNAEESNSKRLGDSVLLSKLESWMERYKRDTEYWGIGSERRNHPQSE